uniref:Ig-like domain-containing protein n=1 Tax=Oreochromis niloticus TaxID=8128 RepID=A0A669BJI2_ORENI
MCYVQRCFFFFFFCSQTDLPVGAQSGGTESGDTVTLPCRAPNNRHITVVDWRRSGLTDKSVLLYRDNKYDPDEQDPSFKNRVALQDVKDGDVSLILKNVTTHDTGIYECRVDQQTESHRRKRAVDPISSTYLRDTQRMDLLDVKSLCQFLLCFVLLLLLVY